MRFTHPAVLFCLFLINVELAHAQQPVPPLPRPAERPLQRMPEQTQPLPAVTLPPIKETPADKLSKKLQVYVDHFAFEGNNIIPDKELRAISRPYEGRRISADELQAVRRAITQHYIDKGYINSGALIPDQPVDKGVIRLQIIEGRLSQIEVSGNDWLRSAYISKRVRLGSEQVLNIYVLKDKLFILQQDPRIKQLHARLEPGARPGESILQVRVVEDDALQMYIAADNHNSPSVGEYRGEVTLLHNNLSGNGDTLSGHYVKSQGLKNYDLSYELPIMADDSRIRLSHSRGESRVVEEPFDQLDIINQSHTSALAFVRPFYRTPDAIYEFTLQGETRQSQTYLAGEPYSFTESADNGKTRLTVVRMIHSWLQRYPQRLITGRSTFSRGTNARQATVSDVEPDGRFTAWLGQAQWVERWPHSQHEMVMRGALQLSEDHLLSMEQFSVGGARTVRGYRENYIVGDNGIVISIEYRIPLFAGSPQAGRFQLAGFTDYGAVRNTQGEADPEPEEIYSAGLGLRWRYGKHTRFELYWARPLHNTPTQHGSLQDDGVHVRFETRVF